MPPSRAAPGPPHGLAPRLRLLGTPHCLSQVDGAWRPLGAKAAALLALLALRGPLGRVRLMTWLWPDSPEARARVSLRGLLRDLRQLAGSELFAGPEPLALAPEVQHDLAADSAEELLAGLDAAGLDEFEDWLAAERAARRQAWRGRCMAQARALARAGKLAEAAAVLEQALSVLPLDEALHRELMRLLAQGGDREAALRAYARCGDTLQRELGVQPAQATRAWATLIELGEALPAPADAEPAAALPAPMVDREPECAGMKAAWAAGRHLLLEGEPGSGKTRLAREVMGDREDVVFVAALRGDAHMPFATLARVLRRLLLRWQPALPAAVALELARLLPELGAAATAPPAHMHTLTLALQQAWQAFGDAGLNGLVLDDLQWADEVSASLMLKLAEAPVPRWLLLRRAGDEPPGLQPALAAACQAVPARWQVLPLGALTPAGVAALLHHQNLPVPQAEAWAAWLCARTLGNALHVVEAVQALLHEQGPGVFTRAPPDGADGAVTLAQLVQRRLGVLNEAEREMAQLMAVAESLFDVPLACAVLGLHELACGRVLAGLQHKGVSDGLALAHDLLREPLRQALPDEALQALHARVAALAAAAGAPAAQLAVHWQAARVWPAAAAAFEQAARDAHALNARADELRLSDAGADAHARALDRAAVFRARLSGFDAALAVRPHAEVQQRAAQLAACAGAGVEALEALLAQARCDAAAQQWGAARVSAEAAWALAAGIRPSGPPAAPHPAGLRAGLLLAAAHAGVGRAGEALALLEQMAPEVQASADLRLRMDHAATTGNVQHAAGHIAAAEAACRRALDLALQLQDGAEIMTLASNLAVQQQLQGDIEAAYEASALSARWAARIGEAGSLPALGLRLGQAAGAARLGKLGEALGLLQELGPAAQGSGAMRLQVSVACHQALLWMDLGQPARARRVLAQAGTLPDIEASAQWQATRVLLTQLWAEDDAQGLGTDAAALRLATAGDRLPNRLMLELALLPQLPPAEALARCTSVAEQAQGHGLGAACYSAGLHEAEAWLRLGEAARARRRLTAVLAEMGARHPFAMNRLRQSELAWRVFRAAGDEAAARAALQQGVRWLLDTVQPQTPPPWRASLLAQHPLHRGLLQAGARAGLDGLQAQPLAT